MRLTRVVRWRWALAIGAGTLVFLGWVGPAGADERSTVCGKTVDEWIGVLRDRSSRDRWRAVSALGAIGPPARTAVPH